MAQKTFESGIYAKDAPPEILWWGRDLDKVTYRELEDKGPSLDAFVPERQLKLAA
jgi:hypothetical protein